MAATAAAIIGALATTAAAGSSIAGQMGRSGNQTADRQYDLELRQLQSAQENQAYQRQIAQLVNERSIAGYQDSQGSSLEYDPATNTWRSTLGKGPQEAQTAADQASVSRNTTDLRQAQLANAIAARRAGEAGPAADQARRAMENFRPTGQDELVGLLQKQATNAANTTFAPLRADTLRSFQRSGTAAGPVLAELGRTENASLRDSLIDAQIKGMTGVDQINQSRRQGLEQSAANTAQLANPQFQYPGVAAGGDAGKALAALVTQRGQTSALAPAYAMSGANEAAKGVNTAYGGVKVPLPSNSLETAGKTIGSALSNKDFLSNIETAYGGLFGPGITTNTKPGWDYGQWANDLEKNWATSQGQPQDGRFG